MSHVEQSGQVASESLWHRVLDATLWSPRRQPLSPPQLPLSSVSTLRAGFAQLPRLGNPMETQVVATSADKLLEAGAS